MTGPASRTDSSSAEQDAPEPSDGGSRKAGRPSRARINQELAASQPRRDAVKTLQRSGEAPGAISDLSPRQRRILEFVQASVEAIGYPPSIREIGKAVGLTSPSSVSHQLEVLEDKGFVRRDPKRPRALEVFMPPARRADADPAETMDITGFGDAFPEAINVPVIGRIAAGVPILASEQVEQVMPMPRELVGDGTVFMLEVRGDSMIEAAICDGDYVVIRQQSTADNGDFVAALLDDEATVKELQRRDGHVWLMPHNQAYEPINGDQATLVGKVVAVLRRM
ncbi:transcriptional repressor LexA [Propionibacterium freudenreichii]|uniref:LexA repressor n=2 Tax=Propionibacterium freudenreichii TaxID=1744 RepID=D7GE61_PROFC|nr:transcriptional repressor LexA [Propionibacterium freudenreichii]PWN00342.1 MAG: transcriptional repressor LexA [Propionibacterium sp.]ARO12105.1 repressor LexA [Propionibacterium freudenreichii]MCQ1998425.1 transcriptional repressor LexA [Propionibacterium freudenreichii]MCT3005393.1 transcriptional repressor LexA [Propionibacterium freudenreichii]MCT3006524.1 transcriptional repressor LexA [Propionibacterium freudenreichii]